MNSGLIGALGTAPLQTSKSRLGSFRGRSYTQIFVAKDGSFVVGEKPNGNVVGGNVPGEGSIQISTVRDQAGQVASGKRSIVIGSRSAASVQSGIAIGANAEASGNAASIAIGGNEANYTATCSAGGLAIHGSSTGQNAVALGRSTSASATGALAIGDGATASNSWMAYSNGNGFGGGVGGNILSVAGGLLAVTTNATPTTMTFARYVSSFLSIPSGYVMVATCTITCASSDGTNMGVFTRRVTIKNVSGTTTLVQSQVMGTDYEDDAGLDVTITADDANDRLKIEVTGIAGTTYRWAADVRGIVYQIGT